MKQKEVEDVLGGKEEFANADSMASKCSLRDGEEKIHPSPSVLQRRRG